MLAFDITSNVMAKSSAITLPGLAYFEPRAVHTSLAAQLVRATGMVPVAGSVPHADLFPVTLGIMRDWRALVERLAPALFAKPVMTFSKRLRWDMLNCRPAFVDCTPLTRFCKVPSLCPFCAGRHALTYWRPIDQKLFPQAQVDDEKGALPDVIPHGKKLTRALTFCDDLEPLLVEEEDDDTPCRLTGQAMVVRTLSYFLAFDLIPNLNDLLKYRMQRAPLNGRKRRLPGLPPSRNAEIQRFNKLPGCSGGLDTTHVGFHYARTKEVLQEAQEKRRKLVPDGWQMEFRQVLFVAADAVEGITHNKLLTEVPSWCRDNREGHIDLVPVVEPTRAEVMRAVAVGLRYSRVPWTGDMPRVLDYLDARRSDHGGRHMAVLFGNLRK